MGFGIIIPVVALIKTSNLKAIVFKDLFILTGVQMVRLAGIFYFIVWGLQLWQQSTALASTSNVSFTDLIFGPYWLMYLFSPVMRLLLSQLFWIKKIYFKKATLITVALLLLIVPSQRILMFVTSLHRDYLPGSWSMSTGDMITETILNIVVFIFVTITIMLAGGKLKKIIDK